MSVTAGMRLGPYELSELIGAGGMGEVYKARDMRLNRDVAIKILPASFAADRERLRRFEQEAQAVAALSDPNILAVYDIGQDNGTHYLVSELLEGESLREMLARGVPSHRKAVGYAVQIAHGLAAAHSRNIAHRDLKPDNIFITRDGRVKILDFGLAKSIGAVHARETSPQDATIAAPGPATDAGTVMGTAGYMSPEQVRGLPVDCRTDLFSFGTVLYEMLTGQRAFKRDTTAETMTAILNEDPPETLATGRQLPPALDRIVRHCLEKSPEQRFQSARDLAFDLESASNLTPSAGVPAGQLRRRLKWWYYAAGAGVLVIIAALGGLKYFAPHSGGNIQFHQLTFRRGNLTDARFTPDGQNVLYTAEWEGAKPEIYTVPASGIGGHSLGIANARLLAVSKQGEAAVALEPRTLSFQVIPGTLARVSNGSGAPKPEIDNIVAADYTPDGSALAIVRYLPDKSVCQLEYPIGKVLYTASAIDDLRFSPSGHYLAFIPHDNPYDDRGMAVILRDNGEKVATAKLYESAEGLAWTPSGNEVWFTSPLESGAIHALSLSGKDREVLSFPGRLFLRDIASNGQLLAAQGMVHLGSMASSGGQPAQRDLSWLDYGFFRGISDDGQMIFFDEEGAQTENYTTYVRGTDGSPAIPIGEGYGAALSRDKKWVLTEKVNQEIWLMPVGAGEPRRISPPDLICHWAAFLPDGKRVVYIAQKKGEPFRIWVEDIDGGEARPISAPNITGILPSPDGKWVLAGEAADLTERVTLMVPVDGGTPKPIAGLKPEDYPIGWTSDDRLYVAPHINPGDAVAHVQKLDPRTGTRTAWRDISLLPAGGIHSFALAISPDGASYGYGYNLNMWDLYTVSGAR